MVQIKGNFTLWKDDSIIEALSNVTHEFTPPGSIINNTYYNNKLKKKNNKKNSALIDMLASDHLAAKNCATSHEI